MTEEDTSELVHRSSRFALARRRGADGEPLVVKSVLPQGSDPARAGDRLRHEYALLRELHVSGVVKVVTLEQTAAGQPALVLEDAGPLNLKQWLRHRAVSPALFLDLGLQLAEILTQLHQRGVIHGNINPTNVVACDPPGDNPPPPPDAGPGDDAARAPRLTLIDFETASLGGGRLTPAEPSPERLECALPYISPEQTGRTSRPVDHRSDLYSLGATFYEILTGAPPFVAAEAVDLVHAHLAIPPVPPQTANPSVPAVLSRMVLRLLAKSPEARYQSADGLLSDLRECRARLRASPGGSIASFELGLADLARALPLGEALFGRAAEQATLGAAWDQVSAGGRAAVLIEGEAGVGKSALVLGLRGAVAVRQGQWMTAKFDLQAGHTPYGALAAALGERLAALGAEGESARGDTGLRLRAVLGRNLPLMLGLLPDLAALTGESGGAPPPAQSLDASHRLHAAFVALIGALATPAHPLVFLVDDLHWADPASLELVRALAQARELPCLLLVLVARLGEAGAGAGATQAGWPFLDRLRAEAEGLQTLVLAPLDLDSLTTWCTRALRCSGDEARPLGELLLRRTGGNPFFCKRLLRLLQQRDLLVLDTERDRWVWDQAALEQVGITDNVAELLAASLERLPAAARLALGFAACIGNRGPLAGLAAARDEPEAVTASALQPAIEEGHLSLTQAPGGADRPGEERFFQFAHDRVQQAAQAVLPEAERRRVHLQIGRAFKRLMAADGPQQRLFAVVDQLNLGAPLMTDPEERLELVRLDRRAASLARSSAAFGAAAAYLRRAIDALPESVWQDDRALAFALHEEAMACATINGDAVWAERLFEAGLGRARGPLEEAGLMALRAEGCLVSGNYQQVTSWANQGLARLGVTPPTAESLQDASLDAELTDIERRLLGKSVEELIRGPRMTAPEDLLCMRLCHALQVAEYFLHPAVAAALLVRMVNLSLTRGHAPGSASVYVNCGSALAIRGGDLVLAHRLGQLGVTLAGHVDDPLEQCRTLSLFGASLAHWLTPLDACLPLLRRARDLGVEAGEVAYGLGAEVTAMMLLFHQGAPLAKVAAELEAVVVGTRPTHHRAALQSLLAYRRVLGRLRGLTDEHGCVEEAESGALAICWHLAPRLQVAYLLGELDEALMLSRAEDALTGRTARSLTLVDHNFYTSLTLARLASGNGAGAEREAMVARIRANQGQLDRWARHCPDNFAHKRLLVEAELARLEERGLEAAELYDTAIEAAGKEGFIQDEALASELGGRFHREQGRKRFARSYLTSAAEGYRLWGARRKADAIEDELGALGPPGAIRAPQAVRSARGDSTSSAALDLMALFRASEAITGEVVLDRLLGRLLEACLAIAGAERGTVVLEEDEVLMVRAQGAVDAPPQVLRKPARGSGLCPWSLLEEVWRTGEAAVIGDALHHPSLRGEPYVMNHAARSLLVVPILRQGRRVGLLHLENNAATRVFTPGRVRLLALLSSQIASALENGRLFGRLTEEIEERKRVEAQVRFLADTGAQLSESLDEASTVAKVARLAVPRLADWCMVDLFDASGSLRRAAAAHRDPAAEVRLNQLREQANRWGPPLITREVLERGVTLVEPHVSAAVLEKYVPSQGLRAPLDEIGIESVMAVPLFSRGRCLGAMILAFTTPLRTHDHADVMLAEELGRRAALAIDNAQLYGQAQNAIRLRDDFLVLASHELNTPIASLGLLAETLGEDPVIRETPELARVAGIFDRQTRRLKSLVAELLDVTRIQSGRLSLELEPVDLTLVVRQTVERFRADLARARCAVDIEAAGPVLGLWDPGRLEQVVTNLLSNALKFGAGRPISLTVEGMAGEQGARLTVVDHGIGIPADRLPHIFKRFERAVPASHYSGLGLGLYIVREIVKAFGGRIRVESTVGQGSSFVVELPRKRVSEAMAERAAVEASPMLDD